MWPNSSIVCQPLLYQCIGLDIVKATCLILLTGTHRWAQLMQKLAPLTAIPLIKKISFANANLITQMFH